jgi:hypothetical protein
MTGLGGCFWRWPRALVHPRCRFSSAHMQIGHQFLAEPRHARRRFTAEGLMATLPDNACLGLRLYFKSPSLGQIKVIDVDATPDDDGEVELLSYGIAELTRRWCAALNRMRKVNDFRPATREEVGAFVRRQYSMDQRRTAPKPAPRSTSAVHLSGAASAKLRELSSRYLGMPQRALAALRSPPRSRLVDRRRASQRK